MYFSQEHREVLKKKNPGLTSAEIMKKVSSAWAHMSKHQKARYNLIANREKLRYDQEFESLKNRADNNKIE